MPYFKYFGEKGAGCYLKDQTVRMCPPNEYNDPFELLPEIRAMRSILIGEAYIEFDVAGGKSDISKYEISEDEMDKYQHNLKINLDVKISQNIGTTCFSRSNTKVPSNLLMWAHYAESHRGMAIQLKEGCEIESELVEVVYKEKRPIVDGDKILECGVLPVRDLYVKSSHWAYESEYRLARKLRECEHIENGIYLATIKASEIHNIVMGVNCSSRMKDLAHDHHDKYGTAIIFTQRSLSGFGIEPCEVIGMAKSEATALFENSQYETTGSL